MRENIIIEKLHDSGNLEDDMEIQEVTEKLQKLRRRTDVTGESFRDLFLSKDGIKNSLLGVAETADYDNIYDVQRKYIEWKAELLLRYYQRD